MKVQLDLFWKHHEMPFVGFLNEVQSFMSQVEDAGGEILSAQWLDNGPGESQAGIFVCYKVPKE